MPKAIVKRSLLIVHLKRIWMPVVTHSVYCFGCVQHHSMQNTVKSLDWMPDQMPLFREIRKPK